MESKKSQGMSIQTVVVATLALVVLVVIIAILIGRLGEFSKSLTCEGRGGLCSDDSKTGEAGDCGGDYPVKVVSKDCKDKGGFCCLPLEGD